MTRNNFDRIVFASDGEKDWMLNRMAAYRADEPFLSAGRSMAAWLPKSGNILDIGPGGGEDAVMLVGLGYDVIGVDVRDDLANPKGWELRVGDACNLPVKDNWADAIWVNRVVHHLKDFLGFLREAKRVMREDGVLILTWPDHSLISTSSEPATIAARKAFTLPDAVCTNPMSIEIVRAAIREVGLEPTEAEINTRRVHGEEAIGYAFPAGEGLDRKLIEEREGADTVQVVDSFVETLQTPNSAAWSTINLATLAAYKPAKE